MKKFDTRDMDLIQSAVIFAADKHAGQLRKYNNTPYFLHPARVAARVGQHQLGTADAVAAAYLHDVVEDTDTSLQTVEALFGLEVASLVEMLTNASKAEEHRKKNRAARKRIDREHIAAASKEAKLIKLIDRIDNLTEIDEGDYFTKIYAAESRLMAEALAGVDDVLLAELLQLADKLEAYWEDKHK